MLVLGLDLSLTSTGFCYSSLKDLEVHTGIITPKTHKGLPRLMYIWDCIEDIINREGITHVVVESYSLGRYQRQRAHSTGELGGVVKLLLWQKEIPILLVSPKGLKKFATGNGNSTKPQVQGFIMTRWKRRIEQEDEADAFVLYQAGLAYWNPRYARRYDPKRREAIEKFELIRPGKLRRIS